MQTKTKYLISAVLAVTSIAALSACNNSDADIASHNVSKAADNFEVMRRIVFFNGITDTYLMTIEGFCSLGNDDDPGELSVTCKVDGGYKKSFLGLSDNVSYFVEQLDAKQVSTSHYRVVFKPSVIVPDIDVR
jgi:hypothetical protein